jgi:hypothetical protein
MCNLTPLQQENDSEGHEEDTIETEGREPLLDVFQLVGIS